MKVRKVLFISAVVFALMMMTLFIANTGESSNKEESLFIKSIQEKYGDEEPLNFGGTKEESEEGGFKSPVNIKIDKEQTEEDTGKVNFRFKEAEANAEEKDNKKEITIDEELFKPIAPPKKNE